MSSVSAAPAITGQVTGDRNLLSQTACDALRRKLVRVDIMPGERLSEPDLRKSLGVGTSPVRDAMRRLEFEHLVVVYPRSGSYATGIALKDSRSVREARLELEGLAATLACQRGSDAEKRHLADLAEEWYATAELQRRIDLGAAFHRAMYGMTRNDYLAATAEIHLNLALRQWHFCSRVVRTPDWAGPDHRRLAAAITSRDPEEAGRRIREHVSHHSDQIVDILAGYGL
ncbi:MAG: GntR family transcriptional regulator [Micromonosporaceae bacterium]